MNVLHDVVCDALQSSDIPRNAEVEFRVPVEPHVVNTLRLLMFGKTADCVYKRSTFQYHDSTDVRCVDGVWQRKRNLMHMRLPGALRAYLVVSVESAALPPALQFTTARRERWTYTRGPWNVDFTCGTRNSNVELEYTGNIDALSSSYKSMQSLLNQLLSCAAYRVFGSCSSKYTANLPFVCMNTMKCPVSYRQRKALVAIMQACQPVSLRAKCPALRCPLLSLKYDGVRLALCIEHHASGWCAVGVCRRALPWHVPCLHATTEMVLDCEYVENTRTFIVFDLLSLRNQKPRADYRGRLREIANLQLPELSCGFSVQPKTIYPMCALTNSWYASESGECDGVIIHDGVATLGAPCTMYKWKPKHTIDLYVGPSGEMMDGSYTHFLPQSASHGMSLKQGQVWECAFTDAGTRVCPIQLRHDKDRANARHVCREILQAYKDDLDANDVRVQMLQNTVVRTSKRKHCAISKNTTA